LRSRAAIALAQTPTDVVAASPAPDPLARAHKQVKEYFEAVFRPDLQGIGYAIGPELKRQNDLPEKLCLRLSI